MNISDLTDNRVMQNQGVSPRSSNVAPNAYIQQSPLPPQQHGYYPSGGGMQPQPQALHGFAGQPAMTYNGNQAHIQQQSRTVPSTAVPPPYPQQILQAPPSMLFQHMAPSPARPMIDSMQQPPTTAAKVLCPPPYPNQLLDSLDQMSPIALAMTARELTNELLYRTLSLTNVLKASTDRPDRDQRRYMPTFPPPQNDPEQLLNYCEHLMMKIAEIRIRLDRLEEQPAELTEDDYLAMMAENGTSADDDKQQSGAVVELRKKVDEAMSIYADNRRRLIGLSSGLKLVDWESTVSAPGEPRRPSRTTTTT